MSSTYGILCLSHDPAIDTGHQCHTPDEAAQRIAGGIEGHAACDLLIGRYSYPLVEVGCPASKTQPAQLRCGHSSTVWVDAEWLRLLAACRTSSDPAVRDAAEHLRQMCWSPERVDRLRAELGLEPRP